MQSLQGACVFRDERAPDAERYKLWTKFLPDQEEQDAGALPGLWAMASPDGLRWTPMPGQPNPPDALCDTLNMFWFDDSIGLWVGYPRVASTQVGGEAAEGLAQINSEGRGRYRAMGRITSPDFKEWSELEIVLEADALDLGIPVPSQRDDPRPNIDFCEATCPSTAESTESPADTDLFLRDRHDDGDEVPLRVRRLHHATLRLLPLGRGRLPGAPGRAAPHKPGRQELGPRWRSARIPHRRGRGLGHGQPGVC